MLTEIVLAASVCGNVLLGYLLFRKPKTETIEVIKTVEVEVGVPICTQCPEQHRVDGPSWAKRGFEVGGSEEGWARNWVGKDNK